MTFKAPLNSLYVPPKGDVCFINSLPLELLSRIFEVGAVGDHVSNGEDDIEGCLNTLFDDDLDEDDADDKDGDSGTSDDDDELSEGDETDEEEGSDASQSSVASFQILVSHVCNHWRSAALSTLFLWTTITVTPKCRPPYQRVSLLLERSKGLPIDIFVNYNPPEHDRLVGCPDPVPNSDLEFLYNLLIPHIHRWRAVRIEAAEYFQVFVFLSAVSDPAIPAAPQLTSLELFHYEDWVEMDELSDFRFSKMADHFVLFGSLAPRLTNVVLWGVHVDWDQPWIASSSTLKELKLTFHPDEVRPSWSQFASILRGASSLERLDLRLSGPSGDLHEWFVESTPGHSSDLNPPIQLPKVTYLVLAFHSERRAIGLLHKFCFPALKELVLDLDDSDYTDFVIELAGPATSLSSAQEKPYSLLNSIEKLKIDSLPCRPECAERLYEELHNLRSLNISMCFLSRAFLDVLSETSASVRRDILLPRLDTLYVSTGSTSVDDVREVVERRREAGVPLTSLHLQRSRDMTKWDVRWFKRNVKTFEILKASKDSVGVIDYEDILRGIRRLWV